MSGWRCQVAQFFAGTILAMAFPVGAATGTLRDVQHVIILLQENRSFDHYFGTLYGVRGFGDPNLLVFPGGNPVLYQPQGTNYVLPYSTTEQCWTDVAHGWVDSHTAWNGGKWDQWIPAKNFTSMAYFERADVPFYSALADAYTVCDAYHCSVLGPTNPNRYYAMTGMIDPNGTGGGPATNNYVPPSGFSWTTYPERLQAAGITWRVYQQSSDAFGGDVLSYFTQYQNAGPGNPLHDRIASVANLVAAFQFDVTNNTLPQVSWIIPPWTYSEHPPYSPDSGQASTKQLLDALASNPAVCNSSVFIFSYDENGGFFDHVPPPTPPPGTPDEFVNGWPIGLGARVPMVIVSPWTRGGYVCSQVFDHTSILRFLENWTGVQEPNISAWRRQVCGDLTAAFDFANPNTNYPALPSTVPVICTNGVYLPVPSPQTVPTQEPGTRYSRPLPYQPNAVSDTDCGAGQFHITMTNSGTASVHFAIYPNAYRADGPWQYDSPPGASTNAAFDVLTYGAGHYDLTCYGPNGFQRRFAGNISTNCNQVEVTSTLDPNAGRIILSMRNLTTNSVLFTLTNGYAAGGLQTYLVPANGSAMDSFYAVTNNNGWYDLTVTASSDASFVRRLAGRIETNFPPVLSAVVSGASLTLSYPAWAAAYTVESSTNLLPGTWSAVAAASTNSGTLISLTVPLGQSPAFFRLRR